MSSAKTDLTILHVSDLHFKAGDRDQSAVLSALWEDLGFLKDQGTDPDVVVFSGDLVGSGAEYSDFLAARTEFIDPLLEKVGLTLGRLVIVPGNHDIDPARVDPVMDEGILKWCSTSESVSRFLDELSQRPEVLNRLENYRKFVAGLDGLRRQPTDALVDSYRFTVGENEIGFAAIDSAWMCTGQPDDFDRGRILVGERQLDLASERLKGCEFRVLVAHHPFGWLSDVERDLIESRGSIEFDLLLFGHNHKGDARRTVRGLGSHAVSNVGCLYASRSYTNGYSMICVSLSARELRFVARSYQRPRARFDADLNVGEGGVFSTTLDEPRVEDGNGRRLHEELALAIRSESEESLLPRVLSSQAPSRLEEIFVEPALSHLREAERNVLETRDRGGQLRAKQLEVDGLVRDGGNLILVGPRESGKTTLLQYFAQRVVRTTAGDGKRLPVLLNCVDLRRGKASVVKAMRRALGRLGKELGIEESLQNGLFVVFLDDFSVGDEAIVRAVNHFHAEYPGNRLVVAMNESEVPGDRASEMASELEFQPSVVFIGPFGAPQTRQLIQNWFGASVVDVDELLDRATEALARMCLPRTPVAITWLLSIFEGQAELQARNEAALLQKVVELLLEKGQATGGIDGLDFRNQEHFLSTLAARMSGEGLLDLSRRDVDEHGLNYFKSLGFSSSPGHLIDHFVRRGILRQRSDRVTFAYRCFFEYFAAQAMIEDDEFRRRLEGNYIEYSRELDFLTGLQRNNRDLLVALGRDLRALNTDLLTDISPALLDDVGMAARVAAIERDALVEELQEGVLGQREKDRIRDDTYPDELVARMEGVKRIPTTDREKLMVSLALTSKVLRNCELIDDVELKRGLLRLCVELWGKALILTVLLDERETVEALVAKGDWLDEMVGEDAESREEAARDLFLVSSTLMIEGAVLATLATEKLRELVEEVLEEDRIRGRPDACFVCTLLAFDLGGARRLKAVERFVKENLGQRLLLEALFVRLVIHYVTERPTAGEKRRIEAIVGDLHIHLRGLHRVPGRVRAVQRSAAKAAVIEALRRRLGAEAAGGG